MGDSEAVTTTEEVVTSDGGLITKTTKRTVVEEMSHSSSMESSTKATRIITKSTGEVDVQTIEGGSITQSVDASLETSHAQSGSQDEVVQIDQAEETTVPEIKQEEEAPQSLMEPTEPKKSEEPEKPKELEEQEEPKEASPADIPQADVTTPSEEVLRDDIKEQLQEIISEIDLEVYGEDDGERHHTWQPKGTYELERTEIQYEDVVPVKVSDVELSEREKKEAISAAAVNQQQQQQHVLQQTMHQTKKTSFEMQMNGDMLQSLDIPEGIPLLAMVLPKDEESPRAQIPLERLFTPATDSGEITPKKGKVFANSAFYRPDHPTMDDQLDLAHKISNSLVDENNKTSRGQTMYLKKKKRSDKWIHQGGHEMDGDYEGFQMDFEQHMTNRSQVTEEMSHPKLTMPTLRPVSLHEPTEQQGSPGIYQNVEISQNNIPSPTGKGAALFAKRKRRMDKFIVDETSIKQQEQSFSAYSSSKQQTSSMEMQSNSSTTSTSNEFNSSQSQLQGSGDGPMYTAEVRVVQNSSAFTPSMPAVIDLPGSGSCLTYDELASRKEEERRKSFNLAPKGWGTYQDFYTPVHLGAR